MIDPSTQGELKNAIADCIRADRSVLDALREEIRPLRSQTRKIQPRATTSISLVGTDGGNNQLQFDPFLIQLVRVVDSSNERDGMRGRLPEEVRGAEHGERRAAGVRAAGAVCGEWIQAAGEYKTADGKAQRVAVTIGQEYGTVAPDLVKEAAKEACGAWGSVC